MATATLIPAALIPVEEYLRTTYRPDRDFIDGELKERNMGEGPHALLQNILGGIFRDKRKQWATTALTEQRVQTSQDRYRIADVCIRRMSAPFELIVRVPPLLCIEILSKGDSLAELQERIDDYQAMGVEHIWAIDPWKRRGYVGTVNGFLRPPDDIFTISGTPIRISLADIFAEFDEQSA